MPKAPAKMNNNTSTINRFSFKLTKFREKRSYYIFNNAVEPNYITDQI